MTTIDDEYLTFIEEPPEPFTKYLEVVDEHRKWFMKCKIGGKKNMVCSIIPRLMRGLWFALLSVQETQSKVGHYHREELTGGQ